MKDHHLKIIHPNQEAKENSQDYLVQGEELLWHGSPKSNFTFTLLDLHQYNIFTKSPSDLFLTGIGIFGVIAYIIYSPGDSLTTVISLFAVMIVLDVFKTLRKKKTSYAITNKRIFFKLWRWGKSKFVYLNLSEISDIRYEEYKDKSGILHLMTTKKLNFETHDFEGGEKRHHPTFENIEQVIELSNRLIKIKRDLANLPLVSVKHVQ